MARFNVQHLATPRWIGAVVVAVILIVGFVSLGSWQLARHEERRALNATVETRRDEPVRPFEGLVGQYGMDPEALVHRTAVVEGVYLPDAEVFSIGRTYDDVRGTLVATPLQLDDGGLLMVVRGVVPTDTEGPPADGYRPPTGRVVVAGLLDDGEEPLRIGEPDPEGGVVRSLSRLDLAYINRWTTAEVLPVSLVLREQQPANPEGSPVAIPEETLSEGRHLGYALQWFSFAAIVVVGVGVLLWRAGSHVNAETDQVQSTPL
ncbi:MAG: SURF1 family protein [Acidimicrobiia bacterium]